MGIVGLRLDGEEREREKIPRPRHIGNLRGGLTQGGFPNFSRKRAFAKYVTRVT